MHTFINPEATFVYAQWIFIKLLAICYLVAFWSLFVQIKGLYGSGGIIPMSEIFKGTKRGNHFQHFYYVPSIFWLNTSDRMLRGTAIAGMIGSLLVLAGIAVPFILFILCFLYLSYVSTCLYFLSFQWDILLIEVGFVGTIFSIQTPPLPIAVFLMWILLFRFMFSSGVVKFLFGSSDWRKLSALDHHYETQPLPNRIAYHMHHLPKAFSHFSNAVVFVVELIIPFLIFTNAELRFVAFLVLIIFQFLIIATGNYAFFNLLTIALCFPLIDDRYLSWMKNIITIPVAEPTIFTSLFVSMTSMLLIVLNFFQLVQLFKHLPIVDRIMGFLSPFYIVNHYGLFSYMTTRRNEVIIEGSEDGAHWKEYEFKWKPGDTKNPPRQVAPHQPRLDWQMWFAALGLARQNPWFTRLIHRLLEGSPDVLQLLKHNPFPDQPPKLIRAQLYRYHFSTSEQKKETGDWWVREYVGIYYPPTSKIL